MGSEGGPGFGGWLGVALEESAEDLYENAPCGYLSTTMDGTIVKANATLLGWLGCGRDELLGRRRFTDLLTVGGKLYHETHFAPLLQMQGEVSGVALELRTAAGERLPVLVTSTVKSGPDGRPLLIRTTVFEARDRRSYETELLRTRQEADEARDAAEKATALVEIERARLQQLAATLQQTLLPPELPPVPGMQVAADYHVASIDEVGGDYYDLFRLNGDTWAFFLGDVCGKGVIAAAVTSLIRYTLRATAPHSDDPAQALQDLNEVLSRRYGKDLRYSTVLFGLLTPDSSGPGCSVTLASGGHPPALLLAADGTARYLPTPGGQVVGLIPNIDVATTTFRMSPGDTLLLYTDGLTEAHTVSPDRYGEEALLEFAASLAPTSAPAVVRAVTALLDGFGEGVDDDAAVLALSIPAPTTESGHETPEYRPEHH
jgi:phosphoserine phosphatase RsbU/P